MYRFQIKGTREKEAPATHVSISFARVAERLWARLLSSEPRTTTVLDLH